MQFGSGAGSLLAQEALLNVVSAVDPDGFFGAGAQDQLGKLGSIGDLAFGALGSLDGNTLAGVLGLDPHLAPLVAAPIAAGINTIGSPYENFSVKVYNLHLRLNNRRARKVTAS